MCLSAFRPALRTDSQSARCSPDDFWSIVAVAAAKFPGFYRPSVQQSARPAGIVVTGADVLDGRRSRGEGEGRPSDRYYKLDTLHLHCRRSTNGPHATGQEKMPSRMRRGSVLWLAGPAALTDVPSLMRRVHGTRTQRTYTLHTSAAAAWRCSSWCCVTHRNAAATASKSSTSPELHMLHWQLLFASALLSMSGTASHTVMVIFLSPRMVALHKQTK